MFKPRGPQKPSFKSNGISPQSLIKFIEQYRDYISKKEEESAFALELFAEYLKNDYNPNEPLRFDPVKLGL